MSLWGSGSANKTKTPRWPKLIARDRGNTVPASANVYATSQGWVRKRAWGTEVLVAISDLANQLGTAQMAEMHVATSTATVSNVAARTLSVIVKFNKPVAVAGSPTMVAISSQLSPANVTLTYDSSVSDATIGKLVFRNTNVNLAQANAVGCTFTCNVSSALSGWVGITDGANAVANIVGTGLSVVFTGTT